MSRQRPLEAYLADFASARLPEPVESTRDVARERRRIDEYLASLPAARLQLLEDVAREHPPMSSAVRLVALLPARFEEHRIGPFLRAFDQENQACHRLPESPVELIVLVNWRAGEEPDATAELVRGHARTHPPYLLLCFERQLQGQEELYPLASVRKLLADYALFRAARRRHWEGPLYLLSEDADVEDVQPGRSQSMIRHLDRHPGLDAVRGLQERTPAALAANDLLLFERRSWFFAEALLSQRKLRPDVWAGASFHWNRVVTGGWNSCFTAEVYAAIGGYSPDVRIFEDGDIGQRISVLRGGWRRDGRFIPDVSTVARVPFRAVSSAARAILALVEKRHIYDGENEFGFFFDRVFEDAVRRLPLVDLLHRITDCAVIGPENLDRFQAVASSLLGEILELMGRCGEALALFRRAMWLAGWPERTYRLLPDEQVEILDPSPFQARAAAFARRHGTLTIRRGSR